MLTSKLFNCTQTNPYPPFKNGLYLEEYFCQKIQKENPKLKRKYIPITWTNFQIQNWFEYMKPEMQKLLDEWVAENPSDTGYFTLVQYDDGVNLKLPDNTLVLGACSGDIPIPLIYEDLQNKLTRYMTPKKFQDKQILCSFIGNITSNHILPNVREEMFKVLNGKQGFRLINSGGWTPTVNEFLQQVFIQETINSKFALAPRGYGRSSFRFFECFLLGTIPIYIWNDCNWLPFQDIIDYKKLCIVIHVNELGSLDQILNSITEEQYNSMLDYYNQIKYLFEMEGMSNQIIQVINNHD